MPTPEFPVARSNPKELMQRPNPGFTAPEPSATTRQAQILRHNCLKPFARWAILATAALLAMALSSSLNAAVLFQQDLSSSATVSDYANATTPNSGQWNAIGTSGSGTVLSITSGALQYARTANAGSFSRTTDFNPTPSALICKWDLTVSANSVAQTTAAVWQFGSGFGTANSAEVNTLVHSRLGLNTTATAGQFSLRDLVASANSANFSGAQTVWWVVNNSGGTLTYKAPDGTDETVADDKADVWVGTTKELNDIAATTTTPTLTDWKFAITAGSETVAMDNFLVDPVPTVPTSSAPDGITSSGFNAKWSAATTAAGYYLDVATDSGFTSFVSGFNNLDVGNVTTKAVTGLSANTAYWYRVRAYTGSGSFSSGKSTSQTLTTAPAAPSSTAATSITSSGFSANWSTSTGATGYRLDVATDSGFTSFVSGFNDLDGGNVVAYAVSGLNASTAYHYRVRAYSANGTSGNSSTIDVTTSASGCTAPMIGTQPSDATLCAGATATFTVSATGTTLTYKWRKNGANINDGATGNGSTYAGTATATLSINNVQTGDAVAAGSGFDCIVTENNNGPCTATTAPKVALTVNTIPAAPTGTTAQSFCSGSSPTVADLVASGTTVQWYAASSSGSPLSTSTALVTGTHYFASQTVSGCESSARFDVTATMNPTPSAPAGTAAQTFCSGNSPTVASLTVTGTGLKWYAAASGGSALASSTALVNETHYFASQTVSGCEGPARFEITAAVNTTPPTPTGSAAQTFCSENNPTTANLAAAGTGIQWYAAASSGSPLASATALVNGTHYYATSTANGCESSTRFDVTASVHTFGIPGATATIFAENMGTPSAITAIVNYSAGTAPATFQNKGTLTYADGAQTSPADVRNSTPSSTYSGASGNGNIWFTTTLGPYGFSIESINAADYTSLTLNFGYHKESASVHATSSVDYWDGTAWQTVANTAAALFDESATAAAGWYAAKPLALPAGAQISDLKIRFVKSGTTAIRIDDVKLTGQTFTTSVSITPGSSTSFCPGGSVLLTATAGGTHYHWHQDGSPVGTDSATYSATASGNYTVTITDANSCSATSLATTVTVNALPGGGADAFSTGANTAVDLTSAKLKLNDTGSGLQITAVTAGPGLDHGSVALSPIPDGTVTYTPKAGYSGNDTFTYTLRNASGCTVEVTVTATIGSGTSQGANAVFAGTDGPDFVAYFAGIPTAVYTAEHATSATGPWAKLGDNITAPITNPTGYGIGVFEVREARVSGGGGFYRTVYPAY